MSSVPHCITAADIATAADVIAGHALRTPVMTSRQADQIAGAQLFFKCENFQRVGAFKFRGAYNAIAQLSAEQRRAGVIAFSSGNHAQAMALAAHELGVNATIVMPHDAPAAKLAATRGYGANVVIYQRHSEDREEITRRLAAERGLSLVPPYDYPQVIAGQGTAAKELFEETGPLDLLLVCTGGGGLLAGSAVAAHHWSPGCRVFGVEPEAGNDVQQAFLRGEPVHIPVPKTIADGAQTQQVGRLTFPIIQAYVEGILTVSDAQLCRQMRFFMERMKMVVEPTGCLAAAAAMNSLLDLRGKKVGVIVSGGNLDIDKIAHYLALAGEN
ncbi:threo-3-hydroxy-L-aspartate ammonia-lyase [Serratia marcescens]|uniref:threo-3-hydroxy-L-aspartate ammonia-lyase n=1 Tax=Serratia marcescens TaxID=615 RepID=UPI0027E566B0|nr:threo-3-hydroxy-L-aspartate ammonia-lyase [Serratia marcescens]